jgi:predicted transcriptional regulator
VDNLSGKNNNLINSVLLDKSSLEINRYFVEKRKRMNSIQIRQRIHEYVDQADERFLLLVNGMINADKDQDWWDDLHPNVQASIDRALTQSEQGKGRPHEEVMKNIRAKYQK